MKSILKLGEVFMFGLGIYLFSLPNYERLWFFVLILGSVLETKIHILNSPLFHLL